MLEVSLIGTINGTLAALEAMRSLDGSSVINVVPLAGLLPASGRAMASAGGQGVMAFSLATRADLEQEGVASVNVSCLCLGPDGVVSEGLYQLLDHPRPVLAVPPWRGTLVRASSLWPRLTPLGSRLIPGGNGVESPGAGKRRRRRS
jgi:NAD(P)-dependent dehydrogenase (short-subunit alcohol dehydrogenase family)